MNDIDEQEIVVDNATADETVIDAKPDQIAAEQDAGTEDTDTTTQDTFPRAYVEELRRENANYRTRAQQADQLAQRLHTELVRQLGALQDPSDLPFDEAHLEDPEALRAAVDALLAQKPHLRSRRVSGDIGQGATQSAGSVDLLGLLRGRA
ncbi:hypothetical protein ACPCXD_16735 [Rhodococcus sp. AB351]|uniref:hypothetical protein n=1 Tax=Rhodococcus sp. AB351 TaxID=3413280 RepID=UPI003C289B6F